MEGGGSCNWSKDHWPECVPHLEEGSDNTTIQEWRFMVTTIRTLTPLIRGISSKVNVKQAATLTYLKSTGLSEKQCWCLGFSFQNELSVATCTHLKGTASVCYKHVHCTIQKEITRNHSRLYQTFHYYYSQFANNGINQYSKLSKSDISDNTCTTSWSRLYTVLM